MNTFENLAAGCLMAFGVLVVLGLSFWLFSTASHNPDTRGNFAVAGAVVLGSGLLAAAIAAGKGRDGPR
jgi:hypothetical protein